MAWCGLSDNFSLIVVLREGKTDENSKYAIVTNLCVLPHVFKQRNAPIISCIVLYLLLNSEHCLIKADANWMKT